MSEPVLQISSPTLALSETRLRYLRNGYRPLPCEGKKPAKGFSSWPAQAARSTSSSVAQWETQFPDATNTGVLTGSVVAVDIDIPVVGYIAKKLEELAYQLLGSTPLKRYGARPKMMLFYRTETPFKKISSPALFVGGDIKGQIEIMGQGQQVIISGTHPETRQPYLWAGDSPETVPAGDLPLITEAAVRDFLTKGEAIMRGCGFENQKPTTAKTPAASKQVVGAGPSRTKTRTKAAIERELIGLGKKLAHVDSSPYEVWWKVAAALRAEYGDEPDVFSLFDQWSQKCPEKYNPDECRAKWKEAATATEIGIGTIHRLATEAGWVEEEKPIIEIDSLNLMNTVNALEDLLSGLGGFYQRGGTVVGIRNEPISVSGDRVETMPRISPLSMEFVLEQAGNAADWGRWKQLKADEEPVLTPSRPPKDVVETFLKRKQWELPFLSGIISAPTLREDGSLLSQPGYDKKTGLFLAFDVVAFPTIPEEPTKAEAEAALADLRSLFGVAPFVTDSDRSVALSFILTLLVRPLLPSAPLHAFSATTAGTGKGFLSNLGALIATGKHAPAMAQGLVKEELEKKLVAALIDGSQFICIDNCERPLGGDLLCQMVTERITNVRVLGKSKNVLCPVTAALSANGNNIIILGDMTRRTLLCCLDSGMERPELREFKTDGHSLVLADRGRYIAAALTMMRGFIAAGSPQMAKPIGSFREWSRLVRDCLLWLGEDDPCETMENARAEYPNLVETQTIMNQWWLLAKGNRILVHELITAASQERGVDAYGGVKIGGCLVGVPKFMRPELREALLEVSNSGGCINPKRLGKWLGRVKNRVVDGRRFIQDGKDRNGSAYWRLESISEAPVAGAEPEAGLVSGPAAELASDAP